MTFSALLVLLCGAAVFADPLKMSMQYKNTLSFVEDFTFYWEVKADTIHMAITANTLGYVSIGFGEPSQGTMKGGDMAVFQSEGGNGKVTDMFAMHFKTPMADKIQDFKFVASSQNTTHSLYEATRLLQTGDSQDRDITQHITKLIVAFGSGQKLTYHGAKRWIRQVPLLPPKADDRTPPETDLQSFKIQVKDYHIPGADTTYACVIAKLPVVPSEAHMVQFEAFQGNPHVHHLVLNGCGDSPGEVETAHNYATTKPCGSEMSGCGLGLFGWAPGRPGLDLPVEAGFPMGGNKPYKSVYVMLNIHYNNPKKEKGLVDNSAVTIKYTLKPRKYDAGVIAFGDLTLSLPNMPAQTGYIPFEITCPGQCTKRWKEPIHVFSNLLHMHNTGARIWNTVQRANNGPFQELYRIDFWDYHAPRVGNQSMVQINPGDRINTHCVYDTMERDHTMKFGRSTQNEMCISAFLYYPVLLDENNNMWAGCGYIPDSTADDQLREVFCGSGKNAADFPAGIANNPPAPENRDPIGCHTMAFGTSGKVNAPVCNNPLRVDTLTPAMRTALTPFAKPCELWSCGPGKCVANPGSPYDSVCQCPAGLSGLHCQTVEATLCLPSPCGANGKCQAKFGTAFCDCKDGFYGPTCEDKTPPKNTCNSKGLAHCLFTSKYTSKCQQFSEYAKCAQANKCADVLKIWCSGIMYADFACATWEYCQPAAKNSHCDTDAYRQCFVEMQMNKKLGKDRCAHSSEFLKCAQYGHCDEMASYICERNSGIQNCDKFHASCKNVAASPKAATSAEGFSLLDSSALLAADTEEKHWQHVDSSLGIRHESSSSSLMATVAAVVACYAIVSMVGIGVALAVYIRNKRQRANASATDYHEVEQDTL
eukprot:TRINITY_DN2017_c0_g1_i1.p1 TRINITY_DN2017_c0_g1~~TRINITY_DN2017_c0_g1_i1.p1  ORF type:complete len:875 (-),score=137.52 TRINITY_DN2017_c0_g1_i1:60-2684(-)